MSVFKWATETRRILEDAELPDTVSFYNIYGTSYDTPYDVWWVFLKTANSNIMLSFMLFLVGNQSRFPFLSVCDSQPTNQDINSSNSIHYLS